MVSFLILLLTGDSLIRSCIPAIDNLFNMCDGFLDSSMSVNISSMIFLNLFCSGVLPSTRRPLGCATVAVGAELFAHLASYWHQAHLDLNFNSVSTGDLLDMTMVHVFLCFSSLFFWASN
jgi:uncharacterized membrane protein